MAEKHRRRFKRSATLLGRFVEPVGVARSAVAQQVRVRREVVGHVVAKVERDGRATDVGRRRRRFGRRRRRRQQRRRRRRRARPHLIRPGSDAARLRQQLVAVDRRIGVERRRRIDVGVVVRLFRRLGAVAAGARRLGYRSGCRRKKNHDVHLSSTNTISANARSAEVGQLWSVDRIETIGLFSSTFLSLICVNASCVHPSLWMLIDIDVLRVMTLLAISGHVHSFIRFVRGL